MLKQIFATKIDMTQAWTKEGRRLPITRVKIEPNQIVNAQKVAVKSVNEAGHPAKAECQIFEIGYGAKKAKQMTKPLRGKLVQAGFENGVKQIRGVREYDLESTIKVGDVLNITDIFSVGDVVEVQGTSKGKGFQGVMKRWNFHGGPKTHGQSDRARAPGSIGQRTQPGRVHKGHHMAGQMGDETVTVSGLTIVYIDQMTNEVWLSGPIPGANRGIVRLNKTAEHKEIELDIQASRITLPIAKETETDSEVEVTQASSASTPETEVSTSTETQAEETKEA